MGFMKKLILIIMLTMFLPLATFAGTCTADEASGDCVNGDVAAWAINKVYLYTDAYCTQNKQTINVLADSITSPTNADKIDFASTPDLGSATIATGTYNCVATKMWDNITFSPATATASGGCVAADNYTQDICNSESSTELSQVYNPDNASLYSCAVKTAPVNEFIWVYFSTAATDSSVQSEFDLESDFQPPTADNSSNGVPLASALVVSAASSGSLKTTLTNRIANGGGTCAMYKPAFSFE
jgi:hypothetical protein